MNNKFLIVVTLLSVVFFVPLFVFRGFGPLDFWWWMSANLIVLIALVGLKDKSYRMELKSDFKTGVLKKVLLGLLSALFLYMVFYIGNMIVRQIFEFADQDIKSVYGFKGTAADLRIVFMMFLIIGPGEELFWRGYLQGKFERRFGKISGYLMASALYTGIHIATGNFMLILAALVCGLFWGWLYMKYRSMLINVISHTLWDIVVFVLLPFTA